MKKLSFLTLVIFVLALPLSAMETRTLTRIPSGPSFQVEVAVTAQEKATGLSFRDKLPENAGMLFVYKQPQVVRMWMKDCTIPLDIIFMDKRGKILFIQKDTTPLSLVHIISPPKVSYVLELNAGIVKKYDIKVGHKIKLNQ